MKWEFICKSIKLKIISGIKKYRVSKAIKNNSLALKFTLSCTSFNPLLREEKVDPEYFVIIIIICFRINLISNHFEWNWWIFLPSQSFVVYKVEFGCSKMACHIVAVSILSLRNHFQSLFASDSGSRNGHILSTSIRLYSICFG